MAPSLIGHTTRLGRIAQGNRFQKLCFVVLGWGGSRRKLLKESIFNFSRVKRCVFERGLSKVSFSFSCSTLGRRPSAITIELLQGTCALKSSSNTFLIKVTYAYTFRMFSLTLWKFPRIISKSVTFSQQGWSVC